MIGSGALGGKAEGLLAARDFLAAGLDPARLPATCASTSPRSPCWRPTSSTRSSSATASATSRSSGAARPPDRPAPSSGRSCRRRLLGDLWAWSRQVRTPLAVRSSSLLEDALQHPFAGVYATKMIPNNQPDPETRFRTLVEAIKFVYASDVLRRSAGVRRGRPDASPHEEKMAVILQEVVGSAPRAALLPRRLRRGALLELLPERRTRSRRDGVVSLALGLGKTIVDGGRVLDLLARASARGAAPSARRRAPGADADRVLGRQHGNAAALRPDRRDRVPGAGASLADAEEDGTLRRAASTYDAAVRPHRHRHVARRARGCSTSRRCSSTRSCR